MTTNDNYTPVKGDRARKHWWDFTSYVDVEYVGRTNLIGTDHHGKEWSVVMRPGDGWIKVEPPPVPLPSSWYAVTPRGIVSGIGFSTSAMALQYASGQGSVIATIRLYTDENGTYQAEIISATPTQGESS